MTSNLKLPRGKWDGVGHIQYRCADCGELMEPEDAILVKDLSYHPDHAPEEIDDGR